MAENLYTKDHIRTISGKYVNVFNTDHSTIVISDMVWSLSNMPRFGGHLPYFYSVLQHLIACAEEAIYRGLSTEIIFAVLTHDLQEGYLLDFASPIKQGIPQYCALEKRFKEEVIDIKFDINNLFTARYYTKQIDIQMLEWEWHNIFLKKHSKFTLLYHLLFEGIIKYRARKEFMKLFEKYRPK